MEIQSADSRDGGFSTGPKWDLSIVISVNQHRYIGENDGQYLGRGVALRLKNCRTRCLYRHLLSLETLGTGQQNRS